jgi:hypothetical protein
LNTRLSLAISWMLLAPKAAADSAGFSWQGFIAQGITQADDSSFINNNGETSAELTELGLNGRFKILPSWHLAGQLVYLDGGNRYPQGARIDYLFLDWAVLNRADWQANLYLGRFKNQHWLFSSTRDVPFTRPSVMLPQSVYFDAFRDIAVASDGVAAQARYASSVGDITVNWSRGATNVSRQQTQILLGAAVPGRAEQEYVHQASVYWQPLASQLSYGISLLDSDFSYRQGENDPFMPGTFTVQRVMLSLRYQAEKWELATELQQERLDTKGFFFNAFSQNQIGQGGYLLAQYRHTRQLKSFAVLDYAVSNKDDRHGRLLSRNSGGQVPAYFGYQHSVGVGFSLDLTASLRLSGETYWLKGTGRLSPVLLPDLMTNQHEYWQLYALQLMYRF